MKTLFRRVLGILQIPLWGLLLIIPRKNNLWVFGAWNGQKFSDNPKYIFLEVVAKHPDVTAIWIVKSKALLKQLHDANLPAAYAYSLFGLWHQIRAGCVVFSHSVEWDLVSFCIAPRTTRVQAWHGLPIKRIGYMNEKGVSRERANLISRLYPHRTDRCDFIPAAGAYDKEIFQQSFNVAPEDVVQSGYPKFDPLWSARWATPQQKQFIYMPTLRGTAGTEFDVFAESGLDFKALNKKLGECRYKLFIKLHPVQVWREQDIQDCHECEHITMLTATYDVYANFDRFSAVITDVSSVFFDFLFLGKPIILGLFDMQGFIENTRSLSLDISEIDVGYTAKNWAEVLDHMKAISDQSPFKPNKSYEMVQAKFLTHFDSKSSARAVQEISQRTL
jgi:CDP-glycerol glycerophosphotransferase